MIENMVGSTFSSSYMHGVVDENNNSYRNMIMDAMRMNKSYSGEYLIIDEEQNADATWFFIFKKTLTNHYGMDAQIIINYRSLHKCSPSNQSMG